MLNRIISIAVVISLLLHASPVFAQQRAVSDDWAVVQSVTAGEKLVIKLKSGKTIKGELSAVTEQALTVLRKTQTVAQPRDQIAQAYRVVGKPAKGKYALIGAGIGALVGMGWGASKRREVLIYQAK